MAEVTIKMNDFYFFPEFINYFGYMIFSDELWGLVVLAAEIESSHYPKKIS